MNRAARRAFAKNLSRALGRAKAHRPPEGPTPEERIAALERELEELRGKHDQLPGVSEERKDWFVLVGGERVEIQALPPIEWVRSLEELPEFLFAFATEKLAKPKAGPSPETVQQIVDVARRWITASAVSLEGVELERLTLPEAEHAVAHIATLNGVTGALRKWFRERLEGVAHPAPGGQELRTAPVEPAGGRPN